MSETVARQRPARLTKNLNPHWVWAIALGSAVGWGAFVLPEVAEQVYLYDFAGWEVYLGEVLIATGALVLFAWVIFVMVVCLIAPWFGRNALSWIVDMASIGFTFAFMCTCACAYKMFQWSDEKSREYVEGSASTTRKLFAAAGVLVAVAFTVLLLAPGSPAQLTMPSFVAMGVWLLIGAVFYISRYRQSQSIPAQDVDVAVLGKPRPEWAN